MKPVITATLLALCACKGGKPATGSGPQEETKAVEMQMPNATGQQPVFPGQTRAKYRTANVAFDTQVVATGLEHPWGLAFLPDGEMLVTERPGRMRIVGKDGALSGPLSGLPLIASPADAGRAAPPEAVRRSIDARDQGGLLDVALDPKFADNHLVYFSYAEADGQVNGTALARAKLVRNGNPRLENIEVIWRQKPKLASTKHYGGRILFDKTGAIVLTLGERSIDEGRHQAQKLDSALGKIVRVMPDGSIPKDNPFVDRPGALPEIWSYGHRNVQAAAWNPDTGALWIVDHGARGGDEINIVERGKDYGWPTISYGIEYKGDKIGEGLTQKAGMEQPIYFWDPVIAPSGMAFYTGDKFPAWKGSLFVGALAGKHVARLTLAGNRIAGEERLLAGRARIRDVRVGPDGLIYVLTDEDKGELLRLSPSREASPSQVGTR